MSIKSLTVFMLCVMLWSIPISTCNVISDCVCVCVLGSIRLTLQYIGPVNQFCFFSYHFYSLMCVFLCLFLCVLILSVSTCLCSHY